MNYKIIDENEKFSLIKDEKEIGYLKYQKDTNDDFIIKSIFVYEQYRGDGFAKIIFDKFIDKVKNEKHKVTPVCSYAQAQFEKRIEIQELLKK